MKTATCKVETNDVLPDERMIRHAREWMEACNEGVIGNITIASRVELADGDIEYTFEAPVLAAASDE